MKVWSRLKATGRGIDRLVEKSDPGLEVATGSFWMDRPVLWLWDVLRGRRRATTKTPRRRVYLDAEGNVVAAPPESPAGQQTQS